LQKKPQQDDLLKESAALLLKSKAIVDKSRKIRTATKALIQSNVAGTYPPKKH
jgi:hypothetical protein